MVGSIILPQGSRDIQYIGSVHDDVQLEVLKAAAPAGSWGSSAVGGD